MTNDDGGCCYTSRAEIAAGHPVSTGVEVRYKSRWRGLVFVRRRHRRRIVAVVVIVVVVVVRVVSAKSRCARHECVLLVKVPWAIIECFFFRFNVARTRCCTL